MVQRCDETLNPKSVFSVWVGEEVVHEKCEARRLLSLRLLFRGLGLRV